MNSRDVTPKSFGGGSLNVDLVNSAVIPPSHNKPSNKKPVDLKVKIAKNRLNTDKSVSLISILSPKVFFWLVE